MPSREKADPIGHTSFKATPSTLALRPDQHMWLVCDARKRKFEGLASIPSKTIEAPLGISIHRKCWLPSNRGINWQDTVSSALSKAYEFALIARANAEHKVNERQSLSEDIRGFKYHN